MRGAPLLCFTKETCWKVASGESLCQYFDTGYAMDDATGFLWAVSDYIDRFRDIDLAG